ncbi:MAG: histone deacetylase family protein [Candidatus Odinarchaeota archaeon]
MKIVFHEDFITNYGYESDPAADKGRIESIEKELRSNYDFVQAKPAKNEDILLYHTPSQLDYVKSLGLTYQMALLAAGGAIIASELALTEEPAFALIRPPGHHASANSCWGFCFFNNIVIAIKKLLNEGKINNAVIIDFDLHFGDGTRNAINRDSQVSYYHGNGRTPSDYITNLVGQLEDYNNADMLAVSAGFDQGIRDWGKLLSEDNYTEIGKILKDFSIEKCKNRRFAVLEGGYNHKVLGKNVSAFLSGFK